MNTTVECNDRREREQLKDQGTSFTNNLLVFDFDFDEDEKIGFFRASQLLTHQQHRISTNPLLTIFRHCIFTPFKVRTFTVGHLSM